MLLLEHKMPSETRAERSDPIYSCVSHHSSGTMVVQTAPWVYHHIIYSCKQFPHSDGEQSWMHTGASAAWFVGVLCAAGDTAQKTDLNFCC